MYMRRGEPSKVIRTRVEAARERQRRRFVALDDSAKHLLTNADTPAPRLRPSSPIRPLTYPRNR